MFKKIGMVIGISILSLSFLFPATALGASTYTYTVKPGDSLWRIAVRTTTGLSELIKLNPQLNNPSLIYPGDKITIPVNAEATIETQVITLVNQERAKAGLTALKQDWELSRVAKYKCQDMHDKNYFDHTSPTYGSPFTMMRSFGINYSAAGENIAQGQTSPQSVMVSWMNSPGHRANILSSSFTYIGIGYVRDGNYWTQMFISK